MNDLVEAILTNTGPLTVAALAGNAAAGGLMLAMTADQVWCRLWPATGPRCQQADKNCVSRMTDNRAVVRHANGSWSFQAG